VNELILLTVGQTGGTQAGSCAAQAMPLLLMFAVFYFLLIRPQQKRQKEQQAMLSRLKKGDQVITSGGLIGSIRALTDNELTLEIADRIKVRVLRQQVNLYMPAGGDAEKKDEN
jgi:preprotein translocase subunit YajC